MVLRIELPHNHGVFFIAPPEGSETQDFASLR